MWAWLALMAVASVALSACDEHSAAHGASAPAHPAELHEDAAPDAGPVAVAITNPLDCAEYEARALSAMPAAPGLLASEVEPSAVTGEGGLSSGPIVGAVSATTCAVWVRGVDPGSWDVRYWPSGSPEQARIVHGPTLRPERDLTATARLTGLAPATAYEYAIERSASAVASGSFRTLRRDGEPGKLRVLVGADIDNAKSQPIFSQMTAQQADFSLLIGDFIYADDVENSVEGYTQMYQRPLAIPQLKALLANTPTFMTWDDHDIQDNFFPGKSSRFEPAKQAYELYVHAHNPVPDRTGAFDYRFRAGDVAFYVLDTRSHRSANSMPDSADKSMLGPEQKADLKAWLACERASVKVLVSSVIFSQQAKTGMDPWNGFATEREELLSFIAEQHIDDVLMVSGDQHWSAVFRFARAETTFYEFLPTPLSKARGFVPEGPSDEILARDDDKFVYGVVDIDTLSTPPQIALTLCADDRPCSPGQEPAPGTGLDVEGPSENVPFTLRLSTDDLGYRAPLPAVAEQSPAP